MRPPALVFSRGAGALRAAISARSPSLSGSVDLGQPERARAQRFVEYDAERIDVRPAVHRRVDARPSPSFELDHRIDMLGCHVGQCSADVGGALAVPAAGACQVEVEQHRRRVGGDEHVGGLDVVVQHPAIVGVLEGLGETCAPPGDRLGERPAAQRLAPFRPRPRLCRRTELVERREQVGPCLRRTGPRGGQDVSQRDPAEIGHAEQMKARDDVDVIRVNRDDVRVLQKRQGLRLARAGA